MCVARGVAHSPLTVSSSPSHPVSIISNGFQLLLSSCAVEDLLAEFLSPVPTSSSDPLVDLVLPLTPTGVRTGSADDALAGLMPSTGAAAPAQRAPDAAADPTAAAALEPPPASAFAGMALAPGDAHPLGELQYSAGSPLSGGGMGSGSIQSYDTPTSTGGRGRGVIHSSVCS